MSSVADNQTDASVPPSPAPPPANEGDEVARLEALLLARSGEVRGLGDEIGRLRALLRDALARLQDVGSTLSPEAPSESAGELMARALEVETARAEAELRLDEALGRLTQQPQLETQLAQLSGTVRGLHARVIDAEELRDAAEARLVLSRDDLAIEEGRRAAIVRDLAETAEQLDLTTARAHALASDAERTGMELRAEIVGLRASREEAETAVEAAQERAEQSSESEEARENAQTQLTRARGLLTRTREELQQLVDAVGRAVQAPGAQAADITLPGVDSPLADPSQAPEALSQRVREARRQLAEVQATARVAPVDAERVAQIIDLLDD